MNKKVVSAWVPRHLGIKGNEKAAELAKQALNFNVLALKVPYTDLKVNVNSFLNKSGKPNGMRVLITNYFK